MTNHYLFGYGSLINAESRARTGASGIAIPGRVQGIQRSWNMVDRHAGITFLGVDRSAAAVTNGLLVAIPETELPRFDRREFGYTRTELDPADVTGFAGQAVPAGSIWIYIADAPAACSPENPVVQSYLDVVLTGCLEVGASFAAEFVRTTASWNSPRIDDRAAPKYQRAMQNVPPAKLAEIDRLLLESGIPPAARFA